MSEPRERRVRHADIELAVWSWPGDPPSALLMHGIGNYARYWDLVADAVDGRIALVAPDARGHGDSGAPAAGYAPENFVADAIAVLDAHGLERAIVVGHSMGAAHAIRLAAEHGDRVSTLVLVDTSPEPLPEGAERARRLSLGRPERFADLDEAMAYVRRTSPGYREAVYANRARWLFRVSNDGVRWRSSRSSLAAILSETRRHGDMWSSLRAITAPTLVVRGTRSNVLSADVGRRMSETLPNGRLIELQARHNVALDRPSELAEAVVALARERLPS